MKDNNITEVVFIIDRSGSMHGLEKDTIGGFNAMTEQYKETQGQTYVSTILFDNEIIHLHDRVSIEEIKPITEKEYYVGGSTALYDAVGFGINHIENIHRYIRKEDVPGKTVFVIITDGYENASQKYRLSDIKKLISKKREEGWEFVFIGSNIDAKQEAENIGISRDCSMTVPTGSLGSKRAYRTATRAIGAAMCRECVADAVNAEDDE